MRIDAFSATNKNRKCLIVMYLVIIINEVSIFWDSLTEEASILKFVNGLAVFQRLNY